MTELNCVAEICEKETLFVELHLTTEKQQVLLFPFNTIVVLFVSSCQNHMTRTRLFSMWHVSLLCVSACVCVGLCVFVE